MRYDNAPVKVRLSLTEINLTPYCMDQSRRPDTDAETRKLPREMRRVSIRLSLQAYRLDGHASSGYLHPLLRLGLWE
jgi:hypothetical protein